MNLQKTYPSLLAADLAAAEGWYTRLLGRGPDHRPMPSLLHWELSDAGGLMLSSSKEIATRGAIFLYVADLAAERRRLDGLGIALGDAPLIAGEGHALFATTKQRRGLELRTLERLPDGRLSLIYGIR